MTTRPLHPPILDLTACYSGGSLFVGASRAFVLEMDELQKEGLHSQNAARWISWLKRASASTFPEDQQRMASILSSLRILSDDPSSLPHSVWAAVDSYQRRWVPEPLP